jgi:molecular chaperone GrpE
METSAEVSVDEETQPEHEREEATDLQGEIDRLQDRLLRLQAEFDNFRKRETRERAAAWARAKADLASKLLGSLDDLRRVAQLDPAETATAAIVDGVALVEQKLDEVLDKEGLVRVGEEGAPFDPHYHEAIAMIPSPTQQMDGRIAGVAQIGYRFGELLLRPARVQVYGDPGAPPTSQLDSGGAEDEDEVRGAEATEPENDSV